MKKTELKTGVEYAVWNNRTGFGTPYRATFEEEAVVDVKKYRFHSAIIEREKRLIFTVIAVKENAGYGDPAAVGEKLHIDSARWVLGEWGSWVVAEAASRAHRDEENAKNDANRKAIYEALSVLGLEVARWSITSQAAGLGHCTVALNGQQLVELADRYRRSS